MLLNHFLNSILINEKVVLRPGFEPGSSAREADILDRAIFGALTALPEPSPERFKKLRLDFKSLSVRIRERS